jgi:hypothetical protein
MNNRSKLSLCHTLVCPTYLRCVAAPQWATYCSHHNWPAGCPALGKCTPPIMQPLIWYPKTFICLTHWHNISQVHGFRLAQPKPMFRSGFENKTATAQKILLYAVTGIWKSLLTMWKIKDWCPNITMCFTCPLLPSFSQKPRTLSFWLSLIQLPKNWEGANYVTTACLEIAYNIKDVSYTVYTQKMLWQRQQMCVIISTTHTSSHFMHYRVPCWLLFDIWLKG